MTTHRWLTAYALIVLLGVPAVVYASQSPGSSIIATPYVGDCAVTLSLPAGVDPDAVRIALDSPSAALTFTIAQTQPFVALLQDPLELASVVIVTAGSLTERAEVLPRPTGMPTPTSCGAKASPSRETGLYDDRSTFEANAYYGRVFDNFAPAETLGVKYVKPPVGDIDSRWTAGVQAQYRLLGARDDVRQLWISTQTLHGFRSADVDCEKNPSAPSCQTQTALSQGTPGQRFFTIIEHADTMEAHVEARYELLRLQVTSDTPVKVFGSTRFGFVAMSGAPKVFSSDTYVGGGVTAPKGSFRGSFAEVGWGRSRQFQSFPEANRLKVYGTLIFDIAPGLLEQAQNIFSQMMGSSRFFAAIVVDRNPGGVAPDAVQTYFGIDFDVRRLVGAF